MPPESTERRRFHRVATDKPVRITADGQAHDGIVLDVSLRGLLFEVDSDWQLPHGSSVSACVVLDEDRCSIEMQGEIVHVDGRRIGLHCTSIDVESAVRLRRMVELNLDDDALLERELSQMLIG